MFSLPKSCKAVITGLDLKAWEINHECSVYGS